MHKPDIYLGREVAVYKIEEFLGEGGFAFVYRAKDKSLGVDMALKVLKPAFAHDEVFEENFRKEAHRAAKFRHPSVITIHYAGKEDDIVFFSMDLLETGLADLIAQGAMDNDAIISVASDVSSALQFAHTHEGGIVHRDLKPDNILFDAHGNAIVTDFGIAEVATNYTAVTGTTVAVGTPKYMSPEQARGRKVDARSDIYSLGVTLYEMATGDTPFSGADWFELGRKHIEEPPEPPTQWNPDLSRDLEKIILKCLAKDPDDRFQSAAEIESELDSVSRGAGSTVVLPAATVKAPPIEERGEKREERERPSPVREEPKEKESSGLLVLLLLTAVLAGGGAGGLYYTNTGGFRDFVRRTIPGFAGSRAYVADVAYTIVEGGAGIDSPITVAFTDRIDPRTATSQNVRLQGPDGAVVPATIRVGDDRRAIEIEPAWSLEYGTEYTVMVTAGVLSLNGQAVADGPDDTEPGARFVIETQPPPPDREPPRLASSSPEADADDASADQPIALVFDEPLDPSSVSGDALTLVDADGNPVDAEVLCCSDSLTVARIEPGAALTRGARYVVRLGPGIADTAGNALSADSFAFQVAAAAEAPVPSGPGTLSVSVSPSDVTPYAVVVVDGDTLGSPPVSGYSVAGGRSHTVEIFGQPEFSPRRIRIYSRRHRVTPRRTTEVQAQVSGFGSITVTSEPRGLVFVDGQEVGNTPVAGIPVLAGTQHTLEIRPLPENQGTHDPYATRFRVQNLEWRSLGRVELPPKG